MILKSMPAKYFVFRLFSLVWERPREDYTWQETADGMTYSFGIFYKEFLTYFGEGKGKTAWIVSVLVGMTLCSGPISSSFVNRWGCRVVTISGAILAASFVAISAFASNVVTLIITIGIFTGFGFGLIYLPAIVSVTVWFDKKRSLATGIAVCGSGLGTFLFPPITEALIETYGWRGAMGIIGAFILNCVPLGMMFRPVPERRPTPATDPMLPQSNNTPLIRSQSSENIKRSNGNSKDTDTARLTLSQPALNKPPEHKPRKYGSGIMERPDVLYQGSMSSLTKYRAASPERQIYTSLPNIEQEKIVCHCDWLPCSAEFKKALSKMLDFSLLVDPIFILFSLSNFLTSIGFYIPFVYIVPMSEKLGVSNSAYLISIIGAANLIGRIFLGYISDKPWVNRLTAYNSCLAIAGISTALSMACWEFWGLAIYSTVFGFTIGAYVGLTSVVLVDLLGLEKLTNAFGLLLLFQGISSLIGPPLAGWLFDTTQSYAPGFYLAGGTIALSGIILFFVPCIERRNNRWADDTTLEQI
ncbi:monocarboxylate transporter 12 isoform X2 [Plodia interpunctella]|uniref:monocarboxylate transporter 12 isoform X2 n=1 Tax=Plodia interpunctella TaxID=58824 RepID=UPI002368628B|nr:monocarboxylate transporter 12 isoform X2 [Plodia interpunctella]